MSEWHSTRKAMEELAPIAAGRDSLSDAAANTRRWTSDFNLTGLVGEWLYSKLTGIPYNVEIKLGDGGEDFPGVDIKTTKSRPPCLRAPLRFKFAADYYVLVYWDRRKQFARVVGWASREEFQAAPVVDMRFGKTYALAEDKLHDGLPPV